MEFLFIGIVAAFNMLIIKFKIDKKRYEDAALDTLLMVVLASLFSGSYGGMVVAMIASLVVSIVFFVSPPNFTNKAAKTLKAQWKEFNDEFDGQATNKPHKDKSSEFKL